MNNDYLQHYGVLGMKWGVRRSTGGSSKSSKRKRVVSDDAREVAAIKKKKRSEMSNAELKKANERMRLEQEYSRLNPNVVSKGAKYVTATVGIMGTAIALYNNSNTLVNIGKKAVSALKK